MNEIKNKTQKTSRRSFLKATAATATGVSVFRPTFTIAEEGAKGANERIGVGFIGTGNRGRDHIGFAAELKAQGRCELVAVCDAYAPRAQAAAQKTGGKVYRTHEELLADPRVDVVCIATPDHHHASQAIDAVRAGKDVYCEKPLTHWSQMDLARKLAEETKKHKRIVQVGVQMAADPSFAKIRKRVQEGQIGKVMHVQMGYFRRGDWGERMDIPDPNATPGPDLDWERFLGNAPKVNFTVSRFFQWRMYWDYAGGPATDLLVHALTPVFCVLDLDYPERVMGGGGTFEFDREVPDQCNIIADYAGGPSVVMMNSLSNHVGIKTVIRGTEGIIDWDANYSDHDKSKGARLIRLDNTVREFIPWTGSGKTQKLWENLLDCVKSRETPYCPIEMGVRVQAPLNMGILSHRQSKVATFDKQKQTIVMT